MGDATEARLRRGLEIVEAEVARLPEKLQKHVSRTRSVGADLAALFGADPLRVDLAIAGHDLYRHWSGDALLEEAMRRGLPVDRDEEMEPLLLHGPVAAAWMENEGGIDDCLVIDAVRYHTTFATHLGPDAAAVFVADKVEPRKVRKRPWLAEVEEAARSGGWRAAVCTYIRLNTERLEQQGRSSHPRAAEAAEVLEAAMAHGRPGDA